MSERKTCEMLDAEHVRLNPNLVQASESDLRELSGYDDPTAAYELDRRKRVAAQRSLAERDSLYDLSVETLLALEELIEPLEELPQSDRLLRLIGDALRVKSSGEEQ